MFMHPVIVEMLVKEQQRRIALELSRLQSYKIAVSHRNRTKIPLRNRLGDLLINLGERIKAWSALPGPRG